MFATGLFIALTLAALLAAAAAASADHFSIALAVVSLLAVLALLLAFARLAVQGWQDRDERRTSQTPLWRPRPRPQPRHGDDHG